MDSGSLLSVVKFDSSKLGAKKVAERHGATDPEVDYLLVRARVKASLGYVADVLEALYKGEVDGWQRPIVDEDPTADYKFRTIITRDEWKRFMLFEIDGIDYDSHVKEETVRRQPEPKVANLYSALTATWSAWAKLQPTPPYGGGMTYAYTSKPDCKNCGHRELSHSVKGDKCNNGKTWTGTGSASTAGCSCTKYEPKPAPPAAKQTGTKKGVGVGEIALDPPPIASEYPGLTALMLSDEGDMAVAEDGLVHPIWCTVWDSDPCICREEEPEEDDSEADCWVKVGEDWVWQEPAEAGETKQQRKARNKRNANKRRAARRKQGINA